MGIKNKNPKVKTLIKEDRKILIGIGATILVLGGIGYWYYKKRKDKLEVLPRELEDDNRELASTITNSPKRPTRFRCSSKEYPLQYGTCHRDVKILQTYLTKIYKEDLGRSGRSKDGVDGMFGNKTNKAAKKHLQKSSFSKEDIDGMRMAIKTIKR